MPTCAKWCSTLASKGIATAAAWHQKPPPMPSLQACLRLTMWTALNPVTPSFTTTAPLPVIAHSAPQSALMHRCSGAGFKCIDSPQGVHSGQQGDGAVPHVARVVHKAVPHLHLCVLEPGGGVGVADLQGPLPHRARPPKVFLPLLPLRVLHPTTSSPAIQQV